MKQPEVDIDDAIDMMSEEAIVCRDLSHSWKPHTATRIKGGFERTLRCSMCSTLRVETLDSYGGLINRHYVYPDNYLVPGMGRVTGGNKDRLRLTSLLRLVEKGEAKQAKVKVRKKSSA